MKFNQILDWKQPGFQTRQDLLIDQAKTQQANRGKFGFLISGCFPSNDFWNYSEIIEEIAKKKAKFDKIDVIKIKSRPFNDKSMPDFVNSGLIWLLK